MAIKGRVKHLVGARGFGFLTSDGSDYFFHQSGCSDFHDLREGDLVSFEVEPSAKGPRATHVAPVRSGPCCSDARNQSRLVKGYKLACSYAPPSAPGSACPTAAPLCLRPRPSGRRLSVGSPAQ
jgi:cold shock protein